MAQYEIFSKFTHSDLMREIRNFYGSLPGEREEIDMRLRTAERLAKNLYSHAPLKRSTKGLQCVSQAIFVLESEISCNHGICEQLPYRHFERMDGCDHTAVKSAADMINQNLRDNSFDDIYVSSEERKESDIFHTEVRNEITAFYYLHGDELLKPALGTRKDLGDKDMYLTVIMNAAYKFGEHIEMDMVPDAEAGCIALAAAAETTRYLSGIERHGNKLRDRRKYRFLKEIKDFSMFTNDEGVKYCEPEKLEKIQMAIRPNIREITEDDEFKKIIAYMDEISINYMEDMKEHFFMSEKGDSRHSMIERSNKGKNLPRFP